MASYAILDVIWSVAVFFAVIGVVWTAHRADQVHRQLGTVTEQLEAILIELRKQNQ